jgi:hypothetical protein
MEHQKIDDSAHVWIITRGSDGRLQEDYDPQFLTNLGLASSAQEVADVIAIAAGEMEIAESRVW